MAKSKEQKKADKIAKKIEKLPEWQAELCKLVEDEWTQGKQYVTDMNDMYDDLYAMHRGDRPTKNFDWESNLVINKVFQVMWTALPYILAKVFGADPIIGVGSGIQNKKGAWQREQILQFWYTMQAPTDKKHIPFYILCTQWYLRALLNGVGIIKKGWHQKLETKSKKVQEQIPLEYDEEGNVTRSEPHERTIRKAVPVEDWPHNIVVNNKNLVYDWMLQPGESIRQGRFITEREIIDLDDLRSSGINYFNLDILTGTPPTSMGEVEDKSDTVGRDGLDTPPESSVYEEIEVFERQGKVPVYLEKEDGDWIPCFDLAEDQDKITMKEMYVTIAKTNDVSRLIRFEENPYGQKTYIDIHIYPDPERWHSTGMIEPIKDLQTAVNDNINAMFDEIWKNLMPPTIVNKGALWEWDTMQYAPRQRWLMFGDPKSSILPMPPGRISGLAVRG